MTERVVVINGRPARVVEAPRVLPPRLDALLASLSGVTRHQLIVRGASQECDDGEHVFGRWLEGLFGIRHLALSMCTNCAAVEVRDVSFSVLPGAPLGTSPLRRRDELLGWYSGARRNGRQYL
jgi:hypothetical protein